MKKTLGGNVGCGASATVLVSPIAVIVTKAFVKPVVPIVPLPVAVKV